MVWPGAVFPEIHTLPCPQRQTALPDRKRQLRAGQNGSYVGRHVIRTLHVVNPGGVSIRSETAHEAFQVLADLRICILRD